MPSHFVRTHERIRRELDAIVLNLEYFFSFCLLFSFTSHGLISPVFPPRLGWSYRGSDFNIFTRVKQVMSNSEPLSRRCRRISVFQNSGSPAWRWLAAGDVLHVHCQIKDSPSSQWLHQFSREIQLFFAQKHKFQFFRLLISKICFIYM